MTNDTGEYSQFGQYRVVQVHGDGTFGKVFKCQHALSGLIVAVKMLKLRWANDAECGRAMREQFADEARTMRLTLAESLQCLAQVTDALARRCRSRMAI